MEDSKQVLLLSDLCPPVLPKPDVEPQVTLKMPLLTIAESTRKLFTFDIIAKFGFAYKTWKISSKHSLLVAASPSEDKIIIKSLGPDRQTSVKKTEEIVTCIHFNESENTIFLGTADGNIISFSFPEIEERLNTYSIGKGNVTFDYCPQGFLYAASALSKDLKIVNISEESIRNIGKCENIRNIRVAKNNRFVVVCNETEVNVYSRDLKWHELILNFKENEDADDNEEYHEQKTLDIDLSPRGDLLAVGYFDKIQLWRTGSWKKDKELRMDTLVEISSFRFSKDDNFIAAVGVDHCINVWDLEGKSTVQKFINKSQPFKTIPKRFYDLELDEDKNCIYTHARDMDSVYRSEGVFLDKVLLPESNFEKDENSKFLICHCRNQAIGVESSKIHIWGLEDLSHQTLEVNEKIVSLALDESGDFLFIATLSNLLKFSTISYIQVDFIPNIAITESPAKVLLLQNNQIFSGTESGDIISQSLTVDLIKAFKNHKCEISFLEIKNSYLISGDNSGKITVFSIDTCVVFTELLNHTSRISYLKVLSDEDTLISVSHDETCRFWSIIDKAEIKAKTIFGEAVANTEVKAVPQENLIMGINFQRRPTLQQEEGVSEDNQKGLVDSCCISIDEKMLALSTRQGEIFFYNLPSFVRVSSLFYKPPYTMARIGNKPGPLVKQELLIFQRFGISNDEKYVFVSNSTGVYRTTSPLNQDHPKVFADCINIPELIRFLKKKQRTEVSDEWILCPSMVNSLHFYADENKKSEIKQALYANSPYLNSQIGTPLDVSLTKGNSETTNIILSQLKRRVKDDINALETLADIDKLISLNSKGFKSLDEFYNGCLTTVYDPSYPSNCAGSLSLPVIKLGKNFNLSPIDLIGDAIQGDDTGISFLTSTIRMNLTPGSTESIDFLKSLIECTNTDIFKTKFIQVVLNDKWEKVKWIMYLNAALFATYLAFLSTFVLLKSQEIDGVACLWISFAVNLVLFAYEIWQFWMDKLGYFKEFWNCIDLGTSVCFYIYMVSHMLLDEGFEWVLIVLIALSWVRGITLFAIFSDTRYMVNLIKEVLIDIIPFALVVFYSILAFFFINLAVTSNSAPVLGWRLLQSYFDAIGNFSTDDYNILQILLVVLASVFNLIIMMNLLISILGDTYGRVNENSSIEDLKQLTELIIEAESVLINQRNVKAKTIFHICEEYALPEIVPEKRVNRKFRNVITEIEKMRNESREFCEENWKISNDILASNALGMDKTESIKKEISDLKGTIEELKKMVMKKSNKLEEIVKIVKQCQTGHDLDEIPISNRICNCDICGKKIKGSLYNCEVCDLEMCKRCLDKIAQNPQKTDATCYLGHCLIYYEDFSEHLKSKDFETQMCRFCNKDMSDKGFYCPPCLFSVCYDCVDKYMTVVGNNEIVKCYKDHVMKWKHKAIYEGKESLAVGCKKCREKKIGAGFYYCPACPIYLCIGCAYNKTIVKGENNEEIDVDEIKEAIPIDEAKFNYFEFDENEHEEAEVNEIDDEAEEEEEERFVEEIANVGGNAVVDGLNAVKNQVGNVSGKLVGWI